MFVSIVIITKNQKEFLERSIPAIFKQTHKDLEAIVVDSGSTDGALECLHQFPVKIVYYDRENFNYARAFNLGARQAKGGILVRLSGDVIPADNRWLEELLEPLSNPKVAAAYSYPILRELSWEQRITYFFQYSRFRPIFEKLALGIMFHGASAAIRKDLWEQVPFDESVPISEEVVWATEMSWRGYKIVLARGSQVIHSHKNRSFEFGRVWESSKVVFVTYLRAVWRFKNLNKF